LFGRSGGGGGGGGVDRRIETSDLLKCLEDGRYERRFGDLDNCSCLPAFQNSLTSFFVDIPNPLEIRRSAVGVNCVESPALEHVLTYLSIDCSNPFEIGTCQTVSRFNANGEGGRGDSEVTASANEGGRGRGGDGVGVHRVI